MESDGSPAAEERRQHQHQQQQQHELHEQQQEGESSIPVASLRDLIDAEKALYPGASTWAPDEDRLFEILFLRQELPLLPSNWTMDFRGVPMTDTIFQTSDEYPRIVYARDNNFHATTALTHLIEVTMQVRTSCQSGLRHKAPSIIKKAIERYIYWAAEDGDYQNLRYIPNITVATVDEGLEEDDITRFMKRHMRALARLQREFLKESRDADFWYVGGKRARHVRSPRRLRSSRDERFYEHARLIRKYMLDDDDDDAELGSRSTGEDRSAADESMTGATGEEMELDIVANAGTQSRPVSTSPCTRIGEGLAAMDLDDQEALAQDYATGRLQHHETSGALFRDRDLTPDSASRASESLRLDDTAVHADPEQATTYRRHPPVVYGLFILHTTVFLVTLDSAKGEAADVSYHVDMVLTDVGQSVWNALTIAIAVCRARDELMARVDDFEPLDLVEESDPDA
ncbi:hypothetical protein HRG_002053 [Hirsutella rhossiliensis]|uniref:Uncharacterized protein n=1 Tax=Hirsutella rhossiliensis TaxID=111463 RepID=A0A9P8N6F1_9HYPO|nr:uncharacterized protein HRG_02053 [Hirsutella rhossiliensis]KAH0966644.1 hypothetical protein HRG_02053 [Hirsutella rhossiliensis]